MCRSPSPRGRAGGTQGRPGARQDGPQATERPSRPAAPATPASKATAAPREAAGMPSGDACGGRAPADLVYGLQRSPKYLPCRFLYDELGSQLYEQITTLPEYYPYETEKQLLEEHAAAIATQFPAGSVVVELGCGDSTKTALLLRALLDRQGPGGVRFCGVDCSAEALRQTERSLQRLVPGLPQEQVELIEAEYLAGVVEVRRRHPTAMLSILWLGSSVGNFSSDEASRLLGALRCAAGDRCQLLLGTDMWKDEAVLRSAYNDSQGVSSAFIRNGMHHALSTLRHPAASEAAPDLFDYEPVVNAERQQVEMWVCARRRLPDLLPGLHIEQGERVLVEISRKFTPEAVAAMATAGGLLPCGGTWGSAGLYCLTLLLTPSVALQRCWADTDSLFASIGDWDLQPIPLRHPFGFYFGHVAAFSKLKLLPQEPVTAFDLMFSRGIDPLVHNPSQCHCHPAVPDKWPGCAQLAAYVAGVRAQLLAAVRRGVHGSAGCASAGTAAGTDAINGSGGSSAGTVSMHALCMAFEHERQHQETLCYMLAQQRKKEAAAAADGHTAVLAPVASSAWAADGSTPQLLKLQDTADGVMPFYLQQCSYASCGCPAPAAAASPDGVEALATPSTPAKVDHLRGKMDGPCLPDEPAGQPVRRRPGDSEHKAALEGFVHVPVGKVCVGIDPAAERGFSWCCELGRDGPLTVAGLWVASRPVTVAQFRRFVFEGQGYQRPELWDAAAFRHLHAMGHTMPATWSLLPADAKLAGSSAAAAADGSPVVADGHISSHSSSPGCTMPSAQQQAQEPQPPPLQLWVHMPEGSYRWEEVADCPAYTSLAEAQAYARWAGGRLLTESENELVLSWADQSSIGQFSPAASGSHRGSTTASGAGSGSEAVYQLESGGWEWTATPLQPLPGWRPDPLYPEYCADFFDGHHFVLRGRSPYTHPAAARRSFRNFYQQLYPFVFAKFRVVKDE